VAGDCVFCAIIEDSGDRHVVAETASSISFLDHRPLFPGHVLVVPREHHETLTDLPPALVEPLFSEVRRVAAAVEQAMGAVGTFVAMNNRVSQSVPHLHVHVVPRRPKDGLRGFFWPRHPYRDDAHAREVASALRGQLAVDDG
jgi:histidine triad (HIT) family protein